mmetsp:Transcript_1249/g.1689  ORF Transcript_1249/g.1689 Transcript_1249/m.1689 type:complete len:501 (+) Transcript_1249:107-1609(+)
MSTETRAHPSFSSTYSNNNFYRSSEHPPRNSGEDTDLLLQALLPPSGQHTSSSRDGVRASNVPSPLRKRPSNSNASLYSTSSEGRQYQYDSTGAGNLREWDTNPTIIEESKYKKKSSSFSSRILIFFQKFDNIKVPVVVVIWYLLGVLSISSTKIILRDYESKGISPLILTVQQLALGLLCLQIWIKTQWTAQDKTLRSKISEINIIRSIFREADEDTKASHACLFFISTFFTMGFLFTNYSFASSDAGFVETIKASEPMTSALVAYMWKIEVLTLKEVCSLIAICFGVVISTMGNHPAPSSEIIISSSSLIMKIQASSIIMSANLCFSFRGMYQKVFRKTSLGSSKVLDDFFLQYTMHRIGIMVLLIPLFVWDGPRLLKTMLQRNDSYERDDNDDNDRGKSTMVYYLILSCINGFAFTHYNLASSFVLTRISVVHHAALNCIRRLFAIVVLSIIFKAPITFTSATGILISIGGFIAFTYYKMEKRHNPRQMSSLLPVIQ